MGIICTPLCKCCCPCLFQEVVPNDPLEMEDFVAPVRTLVEDFETRMNKRFDDFVRSEMDSPSPPPPPPSVPVDVAVAVDAVVPEIIVTEIAALKTQFSEFSERLDELVMSHPTMTVAASAESELPVPEPPPVEMNPVSVQGFLDVDEIAEDKSMQELWGMTHSKFRGLYAMLCAVEGHDDPLSVVVDVVQLIDLTADEFITSTVRPQVAECLQVVEGPFQSLRRQFLSARATKLVLGALVHEGSSVLFVPPETEEKDPFLSDDSDEDEEDEQEDDQDLKNQLNDPFPDLLARVGTRNGLKRAVLILQDPDITSQASGMLRCWTLIKLRIQFLPRVGNRIRSFREVPAQTAFDEKLHQVLHVQLRDDLQLAVVANTILPGLLVTDLTGTPILEIKAYVVIE